MIVGPEGMELQRAAEDFTAARDAGGPGNVDALYAAAVSFALANLPEPDEEVIDRTTLYRAAAEYWRRATEWRQRRAGAQ